MQVSVSSPQRRRGGCCLISFIVVIALIVVAGAVVGIAAPLLVTGAMSGSALGPILGRIGVNPDILSPDRFLTAQFGIETKELEGVDPRRYEAYASYPQARAYAGDGADLVSLRVFGARGDGTLDLTATYTPQPNAEYKFVRRLAQPPPNAPPVGAGGSVKGDWYETITVRVYEPGQRRRITSSSARVDYVNKGMERRVEEPTGTPPATIVAPTCTLQAIWQQAIIRGARPDAVANIDYTKDGYHFMIQGTPVNFRLGPDCRPKT
jgi:hypothetical protein